jgi:predicted Fe-Mo cluster-binding NifX family protein
MKLAIITDDGKSISQHFGRAQFYQVLTIEDGKVTAHEMRSKLGHGHFGGGEDHHQHDHTHGLDEATHNKHASMAEAIADCEAVICGGMGWGAYESMRRLNIRPVVTDQLGDIDAAALAYAAGTLVDHTEKLH